MIDWVSCKILWPHYPLQTGYVECVDGDGVQVYKTVQLLPVEGSHSAKLAVRSTGELDSQGRATVLQISGNPSKFLQGHNLFGSDDLCSLVHDTLVRLDGILSLGLDRVTLARVKAGEFDLSRVDINYSFALPSQADVMNWIRSAEFKSRTRSGRPVSQPGTIYWQASKRYRIKAYSKWNELKNGGKAHRLPESLGEETIERLLSWCENVLRIEVQLNSTELGHLKLRRAKDMAPRIKEVFSQYQGYIVMSENLRLTDSELLDLPRSVASTYTLWKEGHLLQELLPKNTFYRHRRVLLEHGVDISIACDEGRKTSNIVPMVRYLEAVPVGVPAWAFTQKLVHHSAAR